MGGGEAGAVRRCCQNPGEMMKQGAGEVGRDLLTGWMWGRRGREQSRGTLGGLLTEPGTAVHWEELEGLSIAGLLPLLLPLWGP